MSDEQSKLIAAGIRNATRLYLTSARDADQLCVAVGGALGAIGVCVVAVYPDGRLEVNSGVADEASDELGKRMELVGEVARRTLEAENGELLDAYVKATAPRNPS